MSKKQKREIMQTDKTLFQLIKIRSDLPEIDLTTLIDQYKSKRINIANTIGKKKV